MRLPPIAQRIADWAFRHVVPDAQVRAAAERIATTQWCTRWFAASWILQLTVKTDPPWSVGEAEYQIREHIAKRQAEEVA